MKTLIFPTQRRVTPHTENEPAELYGEFGEPLERCIYSYHTPDGENLFVAVDGEGRVVASTAVPEIPDEPTRALKAEHYQSHLIAHQSWHNALGEVWIALELADPCDAPKFIYPDVRLVPLGA